MDLAGRWDLVIEQGATFERYFRWENSLGAPRDLSSYSLRMNIRRFFDDDSVIATTEGASPAIVISEPGATGVFKVTMTAAATAALDFTRAVYDIEAYDGSSNVHRVVQGSIRLDKEVTRVTS